MPCFDAEINPQKKDGTTPTLVYVLQCPLCFGRWLTDDPTCLAWPPWCPACPQAWLYVRATWDLQSLLPFCRQGVD